MRTVASCYWLEHAQLPPRCFGAVRLGFLEEGTDPPPETTTIRFAKDPSICLAPQYVVSDMLNAEGVTNGAYVESDAALGLARAVANGDIDVTMHFSGPLLPEIDRGLGITVVAGVHVG